MGKRTNKLTVPLMKRADAGNHHLNGICVTGRSKELLLEIRDLLNVFAPTGDDYRHSLWIEVPRGKPSGCPLIVHDAQKLLDVLEERDSVKLTPHTFHDYLNHHDEGSVFDLPYECYLGDGDEMTREQYDEIVALTKWQPEEQVELDVTVPLEDVCE